MTTIQTILAAVELGASVIFINQKVLLNTDSHHEVFTLKPAQMKYLALMLSEPKQWN